MSPKAQKCLWCGAVITKKAKAIKHWLSCPVLKKRKKKAIEKKHREEKYEDPRFAPVPYYPDEPRRLHPTFSKMLKCEYCETRFRTQERLEAHQLTCPNRPGWLADTTPTIDVSMEPMRPIPLDSGMRADRESPTPVKPRSIYTGLHGDDGGEDATCGTHSFRDNGQFGSLPSHEDMG